MSAALIKRMREQRMRWVELEGDKAVRVIRPTQVEVMRHLFKAGDLSVSLEDVQRFTVDWRGFTEADLLGAAVGSSDPIEFSAELWLELSGEHATWLNQLANSLLEMILEKYGAEKESAKN